MKQAAEKPWWGTAGSAGRGPLRGVAAAHLAPLSSPHSPQVVLVRAGQHGVGAGGAARSSQNALGEQEVAEEGGDQQVLAEQALEQVWRREKGGQR